MDILADALNTIKTHEIAGQKKCTVRYSKLIEKVLDILKQQGYIAAFNKITVGPSDLFDVELSGKINEAKVVKPRAPVKKNEWARFEQRFLPAYNIGVIIVSTSQGVLTNMDAQEKGLGGRLVAYVY